MLQESTAQGVQSALSECLPFFDDCLVLWGICSVASLSGINCAGGQTRSCESCRWEALGRKDAPRGEAGEAADSAGSRGKPQGVVEGDEG